MPFFNSLMLFSLDFGASTIDALWWRNKKIFKLRSFDTQPNFYENLESFFRDFPLELRGISCIHVTGGKSHLFKRIFRGVKVQSVSEIDAIGYGGWYLHPKKMDRSFLVVSMGTGTCMVHVKVVSKERIRCQHIGGTGVGGGTFLGLAREILGETDISKLIRRFRHGNLRHIDLSVRDIIGSGIGIVPGDATASNLGKLAYASSEIRFSQDDLALGIANLIGQTLATTSIFAAQAHKLKTIILTGKLTRIQKIMDVIFSVGKIYGMNIVLPQRAQYVSAIGAAIYPNVL